MFFYRFFGMLKMKRFFVEGYDGISSDHIWLCGFAIPMKQAGKIYRAVAVLKNSCKEKKEIYDTRNGL